MVANSDLSNHQEQLEIQDKQKLDNNISIVDVEESVANLNSYITQDGPVQPLLVTGESGCGKSFLLSRWVSYLQQTLPSSCVLYHVVCANSVDSTDPTLLTRRFVHLLLDQEPILSEDFQLDKEFTQWLDRACNRFSNGIVIVIDSADLLKNNMDYFTWLLDPLPVPVRVIISVSGSNHPEKWLSWPTLKLTCPNVGNISMLKTQIVPEFMEKLERPLTQLFPDTTFSKTANRNLSNYIFRDLLASILHCLIPETYWLSTLEICLRFKSLIEFYIYILDNVLESYNEILVTEILCLICISYNGLTIMELKDILKHQTFVEIITILSVLTECHLIIAVYGLLRLSRKQVKEAVCSKFNIKDGSSTNSHVIKLRERIIHFFMKKLKAGCISYRVADELPWQLKMSDNKNALKMCLETMKLFVRLYQRGKVSTIIAYWKYLGFEVNDVYKIYMEVLKQMESNIELNDVLPLFYDILGECMRDLGEYKASHLTYEKALELKEACFDADDIRIGRSFVYLGKLFMQWKKLQTAEDYYKQALENYEQNNADGDINYIRCLESLAVLYLIQEKSTDAELYKRQASSLRQKYFEDHSSCKLAFIECQNIIDDLMKEDSPSEELASFLTDLGLVHFNLQQYDHAATFLHHALQMYTAVVGKHNISVAEAMCKLGLVYQETKMFDKAEYYLEQSIPIFNQNFAFDNPIMKTALKILTKFYKEQNKFDKTESMYRNMLEHQRMRDDSDPSVAYSTSKLAAQLTKMGRFEEAVELYHHALQIYNKHFGFQTPQITYVLSKMAKLYSEQNDRATAAYFYKLSMDTDRHIAQLAL